MIRIYIGYSFFICLFLFSGFGLQAQQAEKLSKDIDPETFIRKLYGLPDDQIHYEDFYRTLYQLYHQPVNLNTATREDLEKLYVLSNKQISNILAYRQKYGSFLSIYELSAITGFDRATISDILPFVTIKAPGVSLNENNIKDQLRYAPYHYFLFRTAYTPEIKNGYMPVVSGGRQSIPYRGSPVYWLGKYRLAGDDLGLGFTFEKDAGERFAWQPPESAGADFVSAHLQLKNRGIFKNVILGDYQVHFGQGLSMSSGFYMGKGSEPVNTLRRKKTVIRPHTSAMEGGFLRGAACTLGNQHFSFTGFYSQKNNDASTYGANNTDTVSGILMSGMHRTATQWANKNSLREQTAGMYTSYKSASNRFYAGIGGAGTIFGKPVQPSDRLYNQYKFSGKKNYNLGLDVQYLVENINFFAELNISKSGGKALVSGFSGSLHDMLDVAFIYRNYARDFHTFYGNAFSESTRPVNEKGYYWGLKLRPFANAELYGFYDRFSFPWFSYLTDAPASGWEYLAGIAYHIGDHITSFAEWRYESKRRNETRSDDVLEKVKAYNRSNAHIQLDISASDILNMKSNAYFAEYRFGQMHQQGMAITQDITVSGENLKVTGRYAVFDTDGYRARVYSYEHDVLYDFSVPAYAGRGLRWYFMLKYELWQDLDIWIRAARTTYYDRETIGSGTEAIEGMRKSEIKVQVKYDF